jgi:hypothetical protein
MMMSFDDCEYESRGTPYIFLFIIIVLFSILIFKIYTLQTQVYDIEAKMDLLKIFVKSKFTEQIKVTFEKELQKQEIKQEPVIETKADVMKETKDLVKENKKSLSEIFHDLKVHDEKSLVKQDDKIDKINEKVTNDKVENTYESKKVDKDIIEEEEEIEEKKEKILKKRGKKIRI